MYYLHMLSIGFLFLLVAGKQLSFLMLYKMPQFEYVTSQQQS